MQLRRGCLFTACEAQRPATERSEVERRVGRPVRRRGSAQQAKGAKLNKIKKGGLESKPVNRAWPLFAFLERVVMFFRVA